MNEVVLEYFLWAFCQNNFYYFSCLYALEIFELCCGEYMVPFERLPSLEQHCLLKIDYKDGKTKSDPKLSNTLLHFCKVTWVVEPTFFRPGNAFWVWNVSKLTFFLGIISLWRQSRAMYVLFLNSYCISLLSKLDENRWRWYDCDYLFLRAINPV